MTRLLFASMISLCCMLSMAVRAEILTLPAHSDETGRLVIYSSADTERMIRLLETFQLVNPSIAIDYHLLDTVDIYTRAHTEMDTGENSADLLISSSMDLQIKLVNDGYAQPHSSQQTEALPEWANWRNEAFGFTYEPAVMVYNKELHPDLGDIRTRFELARLLTRAPERFSGKVVTYDPTRSGVGFMFATQDAIQSEDFWFLARAIGSVQPVLEGSTAAMIDKIADGRALIGYNVLGSYAHARARENPALEIVIPDDYALIMTRVAMITRTARNPDEAALFIDFLLSSRGQNLIANAASLFAILPGSEGGASAQTLQRQSSGPLLPIKLSPGLLVYLDTMKRGLFLSRWERAMGLP